MGRAGTIRTIAGRRCATLLVVAASLCQPILSTSAGSESFLHQLAVRTGRAEVYTAAVHPSVAAHLESSPVRTHVCALDCYLASRTPVEPPFAAPLGALPALAGLQSAGSRPVLPGADLRDSSPRAPPLL